MGCDGVVATRIAKAERDQDVEVPNWKEGRP